MSPCAILCPSDPFLARAVTAKSAIDDAVSKPVSQHKKLDSDGPLSVSNRVFTEPKKYSYGIHLI